MPKYGSPSFLCGIVADRTVSAEKPAPLWRSILGSRNVWLLCVVASANGYGFYFVITWLPTFLATLGFSPTTLAFYAGLPMIFAVPADLLGGVTTDYLARKLGLRLGRALVGGAAYAAPRWPCSPRPGQSRAIT